MARDRITVVDVAEAAGVSRSTVSLVLRGSPSISRPTQERVLAKIKELGYVYDRRAASLRASKSHIVGLVIHDLLNPVFAELAVGVDSVSQAEGYVQFLSHTADDVQRQQEVITMMQENGIAGLILSPAHGTRPRDLDALRRAGLPIVQMGRSVARAGIPYVVSDNRAGAAAAVRYLRELGHEEIAFVGGLTDSRTFQERVRGFREALHDTGAPDRPAPVIPAEPSRAGGGEAFEQLRRQRLPTAVVCFNDAVALGVYGALREAGLEPARDLSVVGFDDVAEARSASPQLTTVAIDASAVGQTAARLLLRAIADASHTTKSRVRSVTLPVRLVVRHSCAPPRSPMRLSGSRSTRDRARAPLP